VLLSLPAEVSVTKLSLLAAARGSSLGWRPRHFKCNNGRITLRTTSVLKWASIAANRPWRQ
jgi:hypothetical protein